LPNRDQLLSSLRQGWSYEEIGRRHGIPPGQAYLIITGLPADGSDVLGPEALAGREGLLPGSSQHLANPSADVPTHDEVTEAWIKRRVRADPAMQAAGTARSAEPPPRQGTEESDDVLSVLGRDHGQVKVLLQQLEAIPSLTTGGTLAHQQRRASIVDLITERLSEHETAEEAIFWPAVREALDDGEELARTALAQEQKGTDLLQELSALRGDDRRFDELVERLALALRRHVAFEDTVFLRLRQVMPPQQRDELGRRVRAQEHRGPTRPNPDTPPANRVAAAPLDRARDTLGRRPASGHGRPDDPEAAEQQALSPPGAGDEPGRQSEEGEA
jgi:hypothetical protein